MNGIAVTAVAVITVIVVNDLGVVHEEVSAIDEVVQELCAIERRAGIDRVLEIGQLILERFFDGNPSSWRDKRRNKEASIRRLAQREDCPYCKSALNEAVAVYVAVTEMPCVRSFGHVRPSHIAAVLRLPRIDMVETLHVAEKERWSVRELKAHVLERKAPTAGSKASILGQSAYGNGIDEVRIICALRESVSRLRSSVLRVRQLDAVSDASRTVLQELEGDLSQLASALRTLLQCHADTPTKSMVVGVARTP